MLFFRRKESIPRQVLHELYSKVVMAARQPGFYSNLEVPDTLDGRFDILCIHMFLLSKRLKDFGTNESAILSQGLFDLFFADMDAQLRQIGVSDLKVGKEVKAMAKAYMGRIEAYDKALTDTDEALLPAAIIRNVFRHRTEGEEFSQLQAKPIADYMCNAYRTLQSQELNTIVSGSVVFPGIETFCEQVLQDGIYH